MGTEPTLIQRLEGITWRVRTTPNQTLVITRKVGPTPLLVLDPVTGAVQSQTSGSNTEARYGLSLSPDGALVASSSGAGSVFIHNTASLSPVAEIGAMWGPGLGVAFHPTMPIFVSSTAYGELVFWDTHTWERLSTIKAHNGVVVDAAVSADGRWLASIGDDGMLMVFDLHGALPWQSTHALGEPIQGEAPIALERTLALGQAAATYGAPRLALTLRGDQLDALERARLATLAGDSTARAAWKQAAEDGAVSTAALSLILSALESSDP